EERLIGSKPRALLRSVVQDLFDGRGCFCHCWLLLSLPLIACSIPFFFCCFSYQETKDIGLIIKPVFLLKKAHHTSIFFLKENACTLFHIYIIWQSYICVKYLWLKPRTPNRLG